jgi:hypothetical protein
VTVVVLDKEHSCIEALQEHAPPLPNGSSVQMNFVSHRQCKSGEGVSWQPHLPLPPASAAALAFR